MLIQSYRVSVPYVSTSTLPVYRIASLTVCTFRDANWSAVTTETDCGISISGASSLVALVDDPAKKPPDSVTVMMLLYVPACSVKSRDSGFVNCTVSAVMSKPGALTSTRYDPAGAGPRSVP